MNKKEFEKELDEKLASLKEEMMHKFEEEDEFPKVGDTYYYLTAGGDIGRANCADDEFDRAVSAIGNMSPTEEEMKFKRERLKVIAELEKYAEKGRKWDKENLHFYIIWNYERNKIDYHCNSLFQHAAIYFESVEKAEEAIRAVGEDRVKRFYLKVEE